MSKPVLCLDFDGVIHSYSSGWKGAHEIPDPPVPGAIESLITYLEVFTVCICTSRFNATNGPTDEETRINKNAVCKWLRNHGLPYSIPVYGEETLRDDGINLVATKPPAQVTIDDRALTFTGIFPDVASLQAFRPWNKKAGV